VFFAGAVIVALAFSLWPNAHNASRLAGILLSLPWGLGVELVLDSIDPALAPVLSPPLMAICGFLNAFLIHTLANPGRSSS
jgi:hypothetical protein